MSIYQKVQDLHPDCLGCKTPMVKIKGVWVRKHTKDCPIDKAEKGAMKALNGMFSKLW